MARIKIVSKTRYFKTKAIPTLYTTYSIRSINQNLCQINPIKIAEFDNSLGFYNFKNGNISYLLILKIPTHSLIFWRYSFAFQVNQYEVEAGMRAAFRKKNIQPLLTVIIVAKRHHTRFYPENSKDGVYIYTFIYYFRST